MPTLSDKTVRVLLDEAWPRVTGLRRLDTGGRLAGCDPAAGFSLEINDVRYGAESLTCSVRAAEGRADYLLALADGSLRFHFRFELQDGVLLFSLQGAEGPAEPGLRRWRIPGHRLVSGLAASGDRFLRHTARRANWSREWCPGTGTYDAFEDRGRVGDATAELGALRCKHACVWNEQVCAAFDSSIYVEPLVTELAADGGLLEGRAGRFSVSAGTHAYRLRGELARPFRLAIGILGDYNGNGRIDWCDAAGWEGDRVYRAVRPLYREQIVYKLTVAQSDGTVVRTFARCLEAIRNVHDASRGLPQVVYLVGWQYGGHDTGYPSLDRVNEAAGGREALLKLIERAAGLDCVVSVHANADDAYPEHPGYDPALVSREPGRPPYGWFHSERRNRQEAHSLNHTLDMESGSLRRRLEAMFDLLPIRRTLHFDAHRPYNEVWMEDGTHIGAECEVQRGLIPIRSMLEERGIDLTTEDTDSEKRGLYNWLWHGPNWRHPYVVVMAHGRVPFRDWAGLQGGNEPRLETEALGQLYVCPEGADASYDAVVASFYLYWMYAEILSRKTMVDYWVGDWGFGVKAWYRDDTRTAVAPLRSLGDVETWFEGIPMARGRDRFLPWREDVIYAFSEGGGAQAWTLPASWEGCEPTAALLYRHEERPGPALCIDGRAIAFEAPAGVPMRLRRQQG